MAGGQRVGHQQAPAGEDVPSAASPPACTYLMLPKPWLWNRGTVMPSCFMFLATRDWAGSMDQLTTACTSLALSLVSTPVRSVASLS